MPSSRNSKKIQEVADLLQSRREDVTVDIVKETIQILELWRLVGHSVQALTVSEQASLVRTVKLNQRFNGFFAKVDPHFVVARYFEESGEFVPDAWIPDSVRKTVDSHSPYTLKRYRAMLETAFRLRPGNSGGLLSYSELEQLLAHP